MRLLRITTLYPSYIDAFYRGQPGLAREPYAVQRSRLDEDFFGWADSWSFALAPLGWETQDVAMNAAPLQRAWAREHGAKVFASGERIAIEQAREFRPDLLWYDHDDAALLQAIRERVPGLRGVLGWTGSALGRTGAWPQIQLMLSCAPEAVLACESRGLKAALLPHAFDPRVAERLPDLPPRWDASFIGQLVEGAGFHGGRLRLLAEVATRVPIELFVPRPPRTWRSRIRRAVSALTGRRKGAPVPPAIAAAHDGVYGLAMYQVLRESRAALNIHADSSPRFASNMRLFEATGVGTCLVTDWKENIGALFEPDREVLTYRDASECAALLSRLSKHPDEAAAIGAAGRRRTLAAHTFAHRAPLLDGHLRSLLR
ncbi:MAG TPA: glycosyltransferase [Candidatus Limnocylindrales bacterium]|nr:glycosyltransferase [Candidatus Limnocylindrales bacterium]